ncbi:MAG TPA: isoprenylcysteine carboxylmethyltransferase family protein [Bryobacteraceae bacterium]|nr:isoprenylcysteine carboxylmethyltransferase family protein [Bryobacteraceae bacterium]
MIWIRGVVFTLMVPCVIAGLIPQNILGAAHLEPGWWRAGWLLLFAGVSLYAVCLLHFLVAHGTPAIFFARHLRFVLGEEPPALVRIGPYKFSRNPMYLAVLLVIFGQAILYASRPVAIYGACAFACFHLVVTLLEEPHLRAREGQAFDEYCRRVRRWI